MTTENGVSPRDFPILLTRAEVGGDPLRRSWPTCSCCHLVVEPRNRRRRQSACTRRRRKAPHLFSEWMNDMRGGGKL